MGPARHDTAAGGAATPRGNATAAPWQIQDTRYRAQPPRARAREACFTCPTCRSGLNHTRGATAPRRAGRRARCTHEYRPRPHGGRPSTLVSSPRTLSAPDPPDRQLCGARGERRSAGWGVERRCVPAVVVVSVCAVRCVARSDRGPEGGSGARTALAPRRYTRRCSVFGLSGGFWPAPGGPCQVMRRRAAMDGEMEMLTGALLVRSVCGCVARSSRHGQEDNRGSVHPVLPTAADVGARLCGTGGGGSGGGVCAAAQAGCGTAHGAGWWTTGGTQGRSHRLSGRRR